MYYKQYSILEGAPLDCPIFLTCLCFHTRIGHISKVTPLLAVLFRGDMYSFVYENKDIYGAPIDVPYLTVQCPCAADVTGVITMKGQMMEKKGVKYYENKNVHVKLVVPKAKMFFHNLFNGDKTLGESNCTIKY